MNVDNGVPNLPQVGYSNYEVLGQGVGNLPMVEEFGRGGGRRGGGHRGGHRGGGGRRRHHMRPGGRGLAGYGYGNPYGYVGYDFSPVYVQQTVPSCGGSNCNLYWNTTDKQFESAPGSQCTKCADGKTCRMQTTAPDGVLYSDCSTGSVCKGEGTMGTCMRD